MISEKQKARMLEAIAEHIGIGKAVPVAVLAKRLETDARMVRALVTALRMDGTAICAHPSVGYFLAETDAELQKYCIEFLERRALHSLTIISKMKKLALPDFLGQLKLKT